MQLGIDETLRINILYCLKMNEIKALITTNVLVFYLKLDRLGNVDNRPSTD